ncbi:hypothetical protein HK17_03460 [Acetobacter indonesiensis]|uniref:Uncharacterized protein n=1 Tax=Acetobacter indonesiensis TaxID=104101 RepID=A0A252AVJ6_9PROT|nr:hypothetical protein HK17_03460 [Acetobacter indonesiensis]
MPLIRGARCREIESLLPKSQNIQQEQQTKSGNYATQRQVHAHIIKQHSRLTDKKWREIGFFQAEEETCP